MTDSDEYSGDIHVDIACFVQVPLSALCSVRAHPSIIGNLFNSTTRFKCVPLNAAAAFSQHYSVTSPSHAAKIISIHSPRYMPAVQPFTSTSPICSHSMFNLANSLNPQNMRNSLKLSPQRRHLIERQISIKKSRCLQKAREAIPHRLSRQFYMNGEPVQLLDREELSSDELCVLQETKLSQNPVLFYGAGIKSGRGRTPREVERFENKLKKQMAEVRGSCDGSMDKGFTTSGSAILEEERGIPPPSPL